MQGRQLVSLMDDLGSLSIFMLSELDRMVGIEKVLKQAKCIFYAFLQLIHLSRTKGERNNGWDTVLKSLANPLIASHSLRKHGQEAGGVCWEENVKVIALVESIVRGEPEAEEGQKRVCGWQYLALCWPLSAIALVTSESESKLLQINIHSVLGNRKESQTQKCSYGDWFSA